MLLETPGQLAGALAAELPPEEVPPAMPGRGEAGPASRQQAGGDYWPGDRTLPPRGQDWQRGPRPRRQRGAGSRVRVGVVAALAVIVVIGLVAATSPLWHKSGPTSQANITQPSTAPSPASSVLKPVSAHGFDALNPSDAGDENTNQAMNVLNGNPEGWSSQEYFSPELGHLKSGTGPDPGHGQAGPAQLGHHQVRRQSRRERAAQGGRFRCQEPGATWSR